VDERSNDKDRERESKGSARDEQDGPRSGDEKESAGGRHSHRGCRSQWDTGRTSEAEREARREARHERRSSRREGRHDRKERVLHTRISEQLSDDIRRLAEDLRVPTSNLVRNVLEEVFSVVESVSDDVSDLVDDVLEEAGDARDRIQGRVRERDQRIRRRGRAERARPRASDDEVERELRHDEKHESPDPPRRTRQEFSDVMGWQPLVLNQTRTCADCEASMGKGERAFVGLTESGISPHTLCKRCTSDRS
jgi:hypothetical protein